MELEWERLGRVKQVLKKRAHEVLKKWKCFDVDKEYVIGLLHNWTWLPGEAEMLAWLGKLFEELQAYWPKIREDLRWRRRLRQSLARIEVVPVAADLRVRLEQDCSRAEALFDDARKNLKELEQILKTMDVSLVKPARPPKIKRRDIRTHGTARKLKEVFMMAKYTERRSSRIVYELMHAWNPEVAPSSPESLRRGYRSLLVLIPSL